MSMTETPAPLPPAKPKRKQRRARRKPLKAVAPAAKPTGLFAGMTVSKCPDGCNAEKCVISGEAICAHPALGGLQASMSTPEALDRFNAAKRYLGEQKWNLTNG